MAESMLAILCHILRGEPVIQERLAKEREGTVRPEEESSTSSSSAAPAAGGTAPVAPAGTTGEAAPATGSVAPTAGGGAAEEGSTSTPRREPQVNQAQLTQVTKSSQDEENVLVFAGLLLFPLDRTGSPLFLIYTF